MVSVVATYYNRRELLINTLNSINTDKEFEFIVVDDASDDNNKIEDLEEKYSFLKVIRLEKEHKNHINPCVPFNIGFKKAKYENIILQNAECYHVGDIIGYVLENLTQDNYLTFSCYSLSEEQTEKMKQETPTLINKGATYDGESSWYNHIIYRPVYYHFCSAITKKNLIDNLGGFDEKYKDGIGYDDNELLSRIDRLGLNKKMIDYPFVYHQWHYTNPNNNPILMDKNRKLFQEYTSKGTFLKVNI